MGSRLDLLSTTAQARPVESRFAVEGMTCSNCARHVTTALQKVPSVESAQVSLETGQATVRWHGDARPDEGALFHAVRQAGYEPHLAATQGTELRIEGMTCSGCSRRVLDALQAVPGIVHADVQLESGLALIEWTRGLSPNVPALLAAIQGAGYNAQESSPRGASGRYPKTWSPLSGWQFNVTVGSALTLPLLVLEWGFGFGMEKWYHALSFALVLPIQLFCGARFYRGAWNQLKVGSSTMDTLVVLSSTTAFVYSTWGLVAGWPGHLFFMESASIITLISVGHWVESKVSTRAAKSLQALLTLAPPTARKVESNGAESEVPVAQLRLGDQVVVRPGDRVPVDSEVLEGASVVDESMLTGESAPVNKVKGERIYAGTTNLHGWLRGSVVETGETTALAQIIAVVQRAQNSRADIQKLGDRVSSVFVPVVVLIAISTGLWWGLAPDSAHWISRGLEPFLWHTSQPAGALALAVYHAASVLIVACPCAMGLATPIAILAGTNVASERGILIRDGLALEKTGRLTTVLFDKTGTLTMGKLSLAATEEFLSVEEQNVGFSRLVASLAKSSGHPLSQAVAALSKDVLPTVEWQEVRGAGVQSKLQVDLASLAGTTLRLGSLHWLLQQGVDMMPGSEFTRTWSSRGATVIGMASDQRLLGVLAVQDTIKPNAGKVIAHLLAQGKRVYMVTGDNRATALALAEQIGIRESQVFADVRPEEKAALVERLQKGGERVAFIGDGINDAPALEQADLGIAVARASDVAKEAADIVLLNSDIYAVPEALALALATLRTIKQNLFWAFFYNTCGIPLAALGFMSPILSAFAMGASDLVVIGNALRLRRWKLQR